jgi:hypothetical protein
MEAEGAILESSAARAVYAPINIVNARNGTHAREAAGLNRLFLGPHSLSILINISMAYSMPQSMLRGHPRREWTRTHCGVEYAAGVAGIGDTRRTNREHRMNTTSKWTMALAMLAGAAYGQVPSTNDTSDSFSNTGMGTNALFSLTPSLAKGQGLYNTGVGDSALYSTTTGYSNTAAGDNALFTNSSGCCNVAIGNSALYYNTSGSTNTAIGLGAMQGNLTGDTNTAVGASALWSNSTGIDNTAVGYGALYSNGKGAESTAVGNESLFNNTGAFDTAVGYRALKSNHNGKYNLAVGWEAGINVTSGSNNIDIANAGEATDGVAADSGVIRIGTQSPTALQTNTYIAGIYDNSSVSGLPVVIDSTGQLGTTSSSERFKTAIESMGSTTEKLQHLQPVTFKYKNDPQRTVRYGLIAEEVAKVYPELVVRDRTGRIDGVRYDELAPMLLNELQRQDSKIHDLEQQVAKVSVLERELAEMHAALTALQSRDQLVAQR